MSKVVAYLQHYKKGLLAQAAVLSLLLGDIADGNLSQQDLIGLAVAELAVFGVVKATNGPKPE